MAESSRRGRTYLHLLDRVASRFTPFCDSRPNGGQTVAECLSRVFVRPGKWNRIVTVAGIWENEYGSRMALEVEGEAVFGIYESTTGATGRYLVAGRQSAADPTMQSGQPVSLAIAWHSVADGPPDAGWHWTSALGGQISLVDDQELLTASHLLVVTCAFEGLCQRGVYCDKLTFRRLAREPVRHLPGPLPMDLVQDPLAGRWRADDGTALDLKVAADRGHGPGFVNGSLILDSRKLEIVGFTDIKATSAETGYQSVAITAFDDVRNVTIALGGWIDEAGGELALQSLTSRATRAADTWLQTDIQPLQFRRADG